MKNDAEIRALVHAAVDRQAEEASTNPRLARQVRALAQGKEKNMIKYRKWPVAALLTAAVLALSTAVAAALGVNPFELLSGSHPEYREIAPYTAIDPAAPVVWTDEKAGKTTVTCEHAYYDGSSLLLGCVIENDVYVEDFEPTADEKARMQKTDPALQPAAETEAEQEAVLRLRQAMQDGTPLGFTVYRVCFSDHSYASTGLDLGRSESEPVRNEDGALVTIRDFWELPAEAWNLDQITVRLPVRKAVHQWWFDGQDLYGRTDTVELSPLLVTVERTEAAMARFAGTVTVEEAQARVSILSSAIRTFVWVELADRLPCREGEQVWCDVDLQDENGDPLLTNSCYWQSETRIFFTLYGTGRVPRLLEGDLVVDTVTQSESGSLEDHVTTYPLYLEKTEKP